MLMLGLLQGCATSNSTIIDRPVTMRPQPAAEPQASRGAIYQGGQPRMQLFADSKPSRIGDILTILIEEKTSATSKSDTTTNRDTKMSASGSVTSMPYVPGFIRKLLGTTFSTSSGNSLDGKGETSSSNTFSATLAVTVIEVLPNGYLVVSGEKQLAVNNEVEFLRFSGVVNPVDIKAGNTVSSTKVADARVEQRGQGNIASAQDVGWLQRIFQSVLPF